jgi:hypothetical protein
VSTFFMLDIYLNLLFSFQFPLSTWRLGMMDSIFNLAFWVISTNIFFCNTSYHFSPFNMEYLLLSIIFFNKRLYYRECLYINYFHNKRYHKIILFSYYREFIEINWKDLLNTSYLFIIILSNIFNTHNLLYQYMSLNK